MHLVWRVISNDWKKICPSGWGIWWSDVDYTGTIAIDRDGIHVGPDVEESGVGLCMIGALLAELGSTSTK